MRNTECIRSLSIMKNMLLRYHVRIVLPCVKFRLSGCAQHQDHNIKAKPEPSEVSLTMFEFKLLEITSRLKEKDKYLHITFSFSGVVFN